MKKQTNPERLESWSFEAVRKFADAATGGEVAAMHESFKRQADFLRRHGDDGSAAFWEAMAAGVAGAAGQQAKRSR